MHRKVACSEVAHPVGKSKPVLYTALFGHPKNVSSACGESERAGEHWTGAIRLPQPPERRMRFRFFRENTAAEFSLPDTSRASTRDSCVPAECCCDFYSVRCFCSSAPQHTHTHVSRSRLHDFHTKGVRIFSTYYRRSVRRCCSNLLWPSQVSSRIPFLVAVELCGFLNHLSLRFRLTFLFWQFLFIYFFSVRYIGHAWYRDTSTTNKHCQHN